MGGRNGFEYLLAALGVTQKNGHPGHPQTQGKIERFHQTLKRWLAQQPPATTRPDLQHQLDTFRTIYNTARPHPASFLIGPGWATPRASCADGDCQSATPWPLDTLSPSNNSTHRPGPAAALMPDGPADGHRGRNRRASRRPRWDRLASA